jgi:hypothetical protein
VKSGSCPGGRGANSKEISRGWGERGREKGERRSVRKIHKRLLYCVNLNRTSLDHLLLGKCADVDRARRMEKSLSHGKDYNAAIIVGKSGQTYLHTLKHRRCERAKADLSAGFLESGAKARRNLRPGVSQS